jgi:hypothetical protein
MINVFFPQGCYGTYVTRCLYNYTNLRSGLFKKFDFDSTGSSHKHRTDTFAHSVIKCGHLGTTLNYDPAIQSVVIVPCADHYLDYYNNQFVKNAHGQLIEYIKTHYSLAEIEHKLATQWNYNGKFDENVPRWIMREWCSFWINDVLEISYAPTKYLELNSASQLTTQDIFKNYVETLYKTVTALGLTITVDHNVIVAQHNKFLEVQKFYNSQNRCYQIVQNILSNTNSNMILHSIFDEAYIQHLLRQRNLEIQCDGLDTFPTTTLHLKTLTYEEMHNTNP